MNTNVRFNEKIAILAALDPASVAPGTVLTAWVNMAGFHSAAALIQTGVMSANSTLDARLRQATDAAGSGAKDIPGKALTQMLASSGKQALIEVRGDELDTNNGYSFIALSVTVGVAATILSAQLFGTHARQMPASAASTVVQIV